jgi:hypothetical protein
MLLHEVFDGKIGCLSRLEGGSDRGGAVIGHWLSPGGELLTTRTPLAAGSFPKDADAAMEMIDIAQKAAMFCFCFGGNSNTSIPSRSLKPP